MIATAAATCIVSACATAPVGGPVAAPPATITAATPTGAATAGSASANAATAGSASAGSASASAATVGSATASATAGSATATPIPVEGSPSPTGPPTAGSVIPAGPVTQADNGETLRLTVGQQFTVVLATSPMMWDQPTAQGSAVTRVSASGGYPGTSPAQAVFRAVAPGTAQVTSATDMQCLHATPRCSVPQEIWSVRVVVG